MGKNISIKGFYGDDNGQLQGVVHVSYFALGANDTLSVGFEGKYQVDMPFRPIEAIIIRAREAVPSAKYPTVEGETAVRGYYSDGERRLVPGKTQIWFRVKRDQQVEMLTVEFMQKGQISIPFGPVEQMIAAQRRSRA